MDKEDIIFKDFLSCYICYGDCCDDKFCETNICKCTGSNRIHVKCFQKLLNQDICSICNTEFKNVDHIKFKEDLVLKKISYDDQFGWKHEYFIDQKCRKQGSYKIYYKNGLLWEETKYKNDLKNGFQKVWDYKGNMFVNQIYKNGIVQN
jgi:hypothetical protein